MMRVTIVFVNTCISIGLMVSLEMRLSLVLLVFCSCLTAAAIAQTSHRMFEVLAVILLVTWIIIDFRVGFRNVLISSGS